MNADIKIDPEFKRLIPPLTHGERADLESLILSEGCRDPIVLWRGTIIDGHNRHEICTKHGIGFSTVEADWIESRDDAERWMVKNALGRRNLSPGAAADLRGRLYRERKNAQGGTGANQHTAQKGKSCPSATTAEAVAEETGVSPRTVKNDAAYSEALDVLEQDDAHIRSKVFSREVPLTKSDVVRLAKKPAKERREAMDMIASGGGEEPMGGAANATGADEPDPGRVVVSGALDAAMSALEDAAGAFAELKRIYKKGDPVGARAALDAVKAYRSFRREVEGLAKSIRPRRRP